MLGWLRWSKRRNVMAEEIRLLGLPVMLLYLPERLRGRERKMSKALARLTRQRVSRLLVPPEFEYWSLCIRTGLYPVDTRALCCVLAPVWVDTVLRAKGNRPEQAVLRLCGTRENSDMERVARSLCPLVRNLIIDVPGKGELAAHLRQEFGMPVLAAQAARADLTLHFAPGPILKGAKYSLRGCLLPRECEILPLLSALWESGRIQTEEITLQIHDIVDFS